VSCRDSTSESGRMQRVSGMGVEIRNNRQDAKSAKDYPQIPQITPIKS